MGRPKSAKLKDRSAAIPTTEKTNKRKVFSEHEDDSSGEGEDEEQQQQPEPRQTRRSTRARSMSQDSSASQDPASAAPSVKTADSSKQQQQEDDDEAPEVISSSSTSQEMQRLKQLHEMVSASSKKKSTKKKRKLKQAADNEEQDGDAELDVSIFEEVQQFEQAGGRQLGQQAGDERPPANQRVHFSSEGEASGPAAKKIGHVTVHLLPGSEAAEGRPNASAALASFGRAGKAGDFLRQVEEAVPRTRFAQFAGQKSVGPAKTFKRN